MTQPPQIGKYEIVRRLGGGGMAEVFAARLVGAEGFSRAVAIKRVLPGYAQDAAFAAMFIQEAQLSARFNHPNVVSVLDFERDPVQGLFLAMEMVEGRDLSDLMHTGLLPIPVVIHVIAEVLRGLGYAHDLPPDDSGVRGVIHRDVSPHNVLLSWEGAVKVSDFGIAKARGAATSASASMMVKGKPAYMSPEQANTARLDGRSDLFSVGVMLWEMLVGRPLFCGGTMHEMFVALLFSQITPPHVSRAEVPEDLSAVAMRLLERQRDRRYATAEEAVSALMACAASPKSGRSELIATLAERFPEHARPRLSRSLELARGTPTPEPLASGASGAGSAGALATASAAPLEGGPRRQGRLAALFAGAVVAATALTWAGSRMLASPSTADAPTDRSAGAAVSPPPSAPAIAPPSTPAIAPPSAAPPLPEAPHASMATAPAGPPPTARVAAPVKPSASPSGGRTAPLAGTRAQRRRPAEGQASEKTPVTSGQQQVFKEAPNLLKEE